jgi:hypothetical protein
VESASETPSVNASEEMVVVQDESHTLEMTRSLREP